MFEFFFKYSLSLFRQGQFVFLSGWPMWLFWVGLLAVSAALGFLIWQRSAGSSRTGPARGAAIWLFQTALAALLLFMLWHPSLSVSQLKPQQNIVAVIVDDTGSMAVNDEGKTRMESALGVLNSGLIKSLQEKFQVRLYKMSDHAERIDKLEQLTAQATATHIGESLKQVVADSSSLPIGAMVLLSDGSDNAGGVDLETLSEIRRQRIPVHTIGFGREQMAHDVEVTNVEIPARSLPESRLSAMVSFHQHGYTGQKGRISIKDGTKVLASQEVTMKGEGAEQIETVLFSAGPAGVKTIQTSFDPLANEENIKNNGMTRLVNVDKRVPRILYFEGHPRNEFKFLRRAVEDDKNIDLFTITRTAQNKLYRQEQKDGNPQYGVKADELKDGFPSKVEDLFGFDGVIIGDVDAPTLTITQQQMLKQFVDRRGGGVLFLGGQDSFSEGGWGKSEDADLIPTILTERKGTYSFAGATVELTDAGRDSLITRIEDDPQKNVERWKKLPYVRTFQDVGKPKLGATVLASAIPMSGGGGSIPLLVIEPYGRGRTALFNTGGSWRWQMLQPVADMSHETFYRQLLRWLVSDTPRHVTGSTPKSLLADDSHVKLRADVRDKTYLPAGDANVEAHIIGDSVTEQITMAPEPLEQGIYTAEWTAPAAGSYVVEVTAKQGQDEIGRDAFTFRREDGVAENFHVEQNRELLQKLSSETGGQYYKPADAQKLGKDIVYSTGGITVRETKDLWDMPAIFALFLLLRGAEWLLRRKWGVI